MSITFGKRTEIFPYAFLLSIRVSHQYSPANVVGIADIYGVTPTLQPAAKPWKGRSAFAHQPSDACSVTPKKLT
jgi:hypothetical protein